MPKHCVVRVELQPWQCCILRAPGCWVRIRMPCMSAGPRAKGSLHMCHASEAELIPKHLSEADTMARQQQVPKNQGAAYLCAIMMYEHICIKRSALYNIDCALKLHTC